MIPFLLLMLDASTAHAQKLNDPATDTQIWPDTQISIKINKNYSVNVFTTIRLGHNDTAFVNKQIGVGLRRALGRYLSASFGYRYLSSVPTPTRLQHEHRLFADLTPRFTIGKGIQLTDRNRIERREVNGCVCSYRYRNRIQIERPFTAGEKQLTPYISSEAYYDTRFKAWNRVQYFAGMRVPLTKRVTLDGFYMRQIDARVKPGLLHVIGTYLRVDL